MPMQLSELINFAEECLDLYGDIPVFIRLEQDEEDLYVAEEQRVVRDTKNGQTAFIIADYELGVEGIGPRLSLVKS